MDRLDSGLQLCHHPEHFRAYYSLVVGLDNVEDVACGVDGLGEELLNLGRVVDIVSKAGCGCLGSGVIFQDHWLYQRLCGRNLGVRRNLLLLSHRLVSTERCG